MNFADRYGPWAVIAGASEGTERAFARQIAARGVPCILIARREAPVAALAAEIKAESAVDCVSASIDLAAADAMQQTLQDLRDLLSLENQRADIDQHLVGLESADDEDADETLDQNKASGIGRLRQQSPEWRPALKHDQDGQPQVLRNMAMDIMDQQARRTTARLPRPVS